MCADILITKALGVQRFTAVGQVRRLEKKLGVHTILEIVAHVASLRRYFDVRRASAVSTAARRQG
ncbi:MAG: hypothetical protein ACXVAM_18980 [Vulcanimicrobiaceae bacterium]